MTATTTENNPSTALLDHRKLRARLAASSYTQKQFAVYLGVTEQYVQKMLKKNQNMHISLYARICTTLQVDLDELLIYVEKNI